MKTGSHKAALQGVRCRHLAKIKIAPPLTLMNVRGDVERLKRVLIGKIGQHCIGKFELNDKCRMLHETLIVLGPSRREFASCINR